MLRRINIQKTPVPRHTVEKRAFMGVNPGTLRRGGRMLGGALSAIFAPKQPYKTLSPLVSKLENTLMPSAGLPRTLLRGTLHSAGREAVNNALIGGVLSGGLEAALAPEGQSRSEAFMHGLGSGAVGGLGYGAISGAGSQLVRNAGKAHLGSVAKSWTERGVPLSRPSAAASAKHMGVFDALKRSVGTEDLPSRAIARNKLLTGAGVLGAELALPAALMPSPAPEPPEPPKQPDLRTNAPAVYNQPQYYKTSAAKTALRPIDLTKLPR